jgi:hypothetical protein
MRLIYRYNEAVVQISETPNEADIEFKIHTLTDEHWAGFKELQKSFEDNEIYTDVLFYAYEDHRCTAIVRQDYYVDFILGLLKHQLLESVEWTK